MRHGNYLLRRSELSADVSHEQVGLDLNFLPESNSLDSMKAARGRLAALGTSQRVIGLSVVSAPLCVVLGTHIAVLLVARILLTEQL
jgi:hypothetical protein